MCISRSSRNGSSSRSIGSGASVVARSTTSSSSEAQMIRAERALGHARAVACERAQAQRDARRARERADRADEAHRVEDAAVLLEARREIGDLDRAAVLGGETRDEHGGVLDIATACSRRRPSSATSKKPRVRVRIRRQQRAEHRIAVERRQAAPDDARVARRSAR